MDGIARRVAEALRAAIATRGQASLAVPGGTTPAPFLERLSEMALDWDRVSVLPSDERLVPESSERSNAGLIRRTLLQGKAQAARLLPLATQAMLERPEHALPGLCSAVAALLPLDLCVLGMGNDGHTASLFPGADRLQTALSDDAPPVMLLRAPGAPEPRLTLTMPVLRGAGQRFLLIAGAEKKAALMRAQQEGPVELAPVRAILPFTTVFYAP
ncbi:MAG: 6-phosphogluconolactonase [Alphaproteobacteria bacterium]|nr:MAG: 6-phosphogluconolactonase [Alphaproteobacteria bacterium]